MNTQNQIFRIAIKELSKYDKLTAMTLLDMAIDSLESEISPIQRNMDRIQELEASATLEPSEQIKILSQKQ